MIILTLGGGLGNQMFEYAFARSLQLQMNQSKIVLNTFHVVKYENNKEALHNLQLVNNVEVCNFIKKNVYKYTEKIKRRYLVKKYNYSWNDKDLFYKLSRSGVFYNLNVYTLDRYQQPVSRNIYIYGVYQNPYYWWKYKDIIKQELKVKTEPTKINKQMIEKIKNCNAVCVHVRRGDYVTNPRWDDLNICNEKYYLDAMDCMTKQVSNCRFFVFSNTHEDILWIQQNYNFKQYNVEYIDLNNPDYEELRLMYSCKHFIIANSTFSWWAQFLSDSKEKKVCAPKYWTRGGVDCSKEFYGKDWKIIDLN